MLVFCHVQPIVLEDSVIHDATAVPDLWVTLPLLVFVQHQAVLQTVIHTRCLQPLQRFPTMRTGRCLIRKSSRLLLILEKGCLRYDVF